MLHAVPAIHDELARVVRHVLPRPRCAPEPRAQARPGSTWNAGGHAPEALWPACRSASDDALANETIGHTTVLRYRQA